MRAYSRARRSGSRALKTMIAAMEQRDKQAKRVVAKVMTILGEASADSALERQTRGAITSGVQAVEFYDRMRRVRGGAKAIELLWKPFETLMKHDAE